MKYYNSFFKVTMYSRKYSFPIFSNLFYIDNSSLSPHEIGRAIKGKQIKKKYEIWHSTNSLKLTMDNKSFGTNSLILRCDFLRHYILKYFLSF